MSIEVYAECFCTKCNEMLKFEVWLDGGWGGGSYEQVTDEFENHGWVDDGDRHYCADCAKEKEA